MNSILINCLPIYNTILLSSSLYWLYWLYNGVILSGAVYTIYDNYFIIHYKSLYFIQLSCCKVNYFIHLSITLFISVLTVVCVCLLTNIYLYLYIVFSTNGYIAVNSAYSFYNDNGIVSNYLFIIEHDLKNHMIKRSLLIVVEFN